MKFHPRVPHRDEEVGHFVPLVCKLDRALHQRVSGMPRRDKIGEWQSPEAITEVAEIDQESLSQRGNVHTAHLNEEVTEMSTILPIADVGRSHVSERCSEARGELWDRSREPRDLAGGLRSRFREAWRVSDGLWIRSGEPWGVSHGRRSDAEILGRPREASGAEFRLAG